jgi:subtilisin family serine protease
MKIISANLKLLLLLVLILCSDQMALAEQLSERYIIYRTDKRGSKTSYLRSEARSRKVKLEIQKLGGRRTKRLPLIEGVAVDLPNKRFNRIASRLAKEGYYIEQDFKVELFNSPSGLVPNDPLYSSQRKDLDAIKAPEAWQLSTSASSVVVGVMDTGIDHNHPDLVGNMWQDPASGAHGYNALAGNSNTMDTQSHGTHVAGIIGASGNNGVGISGVSWSVKLMALKVLDGSSGGSISGMVDALGYAVNQKRAGVNLRIINASLGGPSYSKAFEDAIKAVTNENILFIAAAGNSGRDNARFPTYPANFPNVLTVGAVDHTGRWASFSNFNNTRVHIAAPGVNVFSTIPLSLASNQQSAYKAMSGTSMAAPVVAGAASLVLASQPELTVAELRTRLLLTASSFAALKTRVRTGGMINLQQSLARPSTQISGTILSGNGSPVTGVVLTDPWLGSITSNGEGRFSFNSVLLGHNYAITPVKIGYRFNPTIFKGSATTAVNLPITATEVNFTASGYVLLGRTGLAGVTVTDPTLGSVVTDSSGYFRFDRVPLSYRYTFTPELTNYRFSAASASGVASKNITLRFTAAPRTTDIVGTLRLRGAPFAGVTVLTNTGLRAVSAANGAFAIRKVPVASQDVTLTFSRAGFNLQGGYSLTLNQNGVTSVNLNFQ